MNQADEVEVDTGAVAHGGHVVARTPEGQVVFVRHALPGERVRARVTEDHGSFLRADAVEILHASPARVAAPCPLAHADGCGGCDFQHVDLDEQRRLKAAVVREQLQRLAGLDLEVVCEAVPGDLDGLRWRTRMQYVDLPGGRRGLRKHRSHDVVPVKDCLIAHPDAREAPFPDVVVETVRGKEFTVAGDGFWQVHPGAPAVLVETVLGMLVPKPGESALDLYSGVGLFSVFLDEAVGEAGRVTAIESDRRAAQLAADNRRSAQAGGTQLDAATTVHDRVDRWLRRQRHLQVDVVVLDPPRVGAKRQVVAAIADARPRAVTYVACDPAALARDVGYFAECGYRLAALRCFDLFPMTHHVECVALLTRA